MQLNDSDAVAIAEIINRHCRPKVERVAVPGPPRKRTVQEQQRFVTHVMERQYVDTGPAPGSLFVLPAAGVVALVVAIAAKSVIGFLLVAAAGVAVYFMLRTQWRSHEWRDVPVDKVEIRAVDKIVEEPTTEYVERAVESPWKVTAVGRVRLPFLAIPVHGGTLLIDRHGVGRQASLSLPVPRVPDEIVQCLRRINEIPQKIPLVLKGERSVFNVEKQTPFGEGVTLVGEEQDLERAYVRCSELLTDTDVATFSLSYVPPGDPIWKRMQPMSRNARATPVELEAKKLHDHLAAGTASYLDKALTEARRRWRVNQMLMHSARFVSITAGVASVCKGLGNAFHYPAFNFYCPECSRQIQEDLLGRDYSVEGGRDYPAVQLSPNTRLVYDVDRGVWSCPQCEQPTKNPVPMHRSLSELLIPVYDRLMEEHKKERLGIYASVRDQERDYTNRLQREKEQLFQSNRQTVEGLVDEIRRLEAELDAESETMQSLVTVMAVHAAGQTAAIARIKADTEAIVEEDRRQRVIFRRASDEAYDRTTAVIVDGMVKFARTQKVEDHARDELTRGIFENVRATRASNERQEILLQEGNEDRRHTNRLLHEGNLQREEGNRQHAEGNRIAAESLEELKLGNEFSEEQNAIINAMAEKQGVERHAGTFELGKSLSAFGGDLAANLLGEDDVDRAKRKNRNLR